MSLFAELQRRNVVKVAILYVVASWLLLQVTDVLSSLLTLPPWAGPMVVMLLVLGFVPALVFAWVYELTPEGLKREKDIDRSESMAPVTGQRINLIVLVLVIVAIVLVVADRLVPESPAPVPVALPEPAAPPVVPDAAPAAVEQVTDISIAVLPFENFSASQEDEYFSDGLSDTVLHHLAQVPDLKVIARNSTFQFKGTNLDVREIGERLGVGNVLEGSVQRYGDQVRVIAQLVRSSDGAHLWSQSFDYRMDNIFALHDAIAAAVVEQLKLSLLPEQAGALGMGGTDNPEAYDLYLRAMDYANRRLNPSLVNSTENIEDYPPVKLLRQALELDPEYVDALVDLAELHSNFAFMTTDMGRYRGYLEGMKPLVDRARELAPEYSRTWSAVGGYEFRSGNVEAAIAAQTRAVELNPNDAEAHGALAVAYLDRAPQKTLEHMRIVQELDPSNLFDRPIVMALLYLQRPAEAIAQLEAGLANGMFTQMKLADLAGINFWMLGRPVESVRWAGKLLAHAPGSTLGVYNMVSSWLAVGDLERAAAWLQAGLQRWPDNDALQISQIRLQLLRGEFAAARDTIESTGDWPGLPGVSSNSVLASTCLLQDDRGCVASALEQLGEALDSASARGRDTSRYRARLDLFTAKLVARGGGEVEESIESLLAATAEMPRVSWADDAKGYVDIEAATLGGHGEQAVAALAGSLLAEDGYLPWDSFGLPADRGHILSRLEGQAGFANWQEEFRRRRDAARAAMIAMESEGQLPRPDSIAD